MKMDKTKIKNTIQDFKIKNTCQDYRIAELKKLNQAEQERIAKAMNDAGYCNCGNKFKDIYEEEGKFCWDCR